MGWIFVAVTSAAVFAVVSILEKVLLARYVQSPLTLSVLTGLFAIPGAVIILVVVPFETYSIGTVITAYVSGVVWGGGVLMMLRVLSRQEVSRVIPVYQTSPAFAVIFAVLFLQEELTNLHAVAILVTISGAVLISLQPSGKSLALRLETSFFLLLLASFLAGSGQFLSKLALQEIGLWNLVVLRQFGLATSTVLLPLRPSVIREVIDVMGRPTSATFVILTQGFVVFSAIFLTLWAISLGPLSLVATIQASRPLFVFFFSIVLSLGIWRILEEPLRGRVLGFKFLATGMIVVGIGSIALL